MNQVKKKVDGTNMDNPNKKEINIATKERIEACKNFIESFQVLKQGKYSKKKMDTEEKKENWEVLQKKMDEMRLSEP